MRTREQRNGINSILVLVAVCVLFFYVFAHQVTSKALFLPGPPSYQADDSILMIEAEDGTRLAAYWGPAPNARATVFYLHGNAEDIGEVQFILNNYRLQGVNALCFDYRGYGLSEGVAREKVTYSDAHAVLDYAIERLGVSEDRLVLHGRSLGGGVAMELAVRRPAGGLILESTFLSAYRVYLPMRWIPGDKFDNAGKAKRLDIPTMVIHGRDDEVVPFAHGEELASLISADQVKTLWIEDAGHHDLALEGSARYWSAIRSFFASLGFQRGRASADAG